MAKLKAGDKIGPFPYQIIRQLGKGQGNMSDVYLATEGDQPDAPLVVLKISKSNSDHSDFFTDTIYNEAERLRQLSHPGIVHLLPIKINSSSMRNVPYVANASLPGRPWFLVLEHLPGGALDEILAKEKHIPPLLALRVAQRLAATLDYIHRCGQVHLDIKPENILFRQPLDPDMLPDPVLIDFGIARNVGQEGLEARTLHYAPPERVLLHKSSLPLELLAKPAPSMDVYSLGVVLYQMLAGRKPYEGRNDKRVSSAILSSNPTRPSMYIGGLDHDVEDIVLQAMAKDPAARPSAGELAQRLEAIAVRSAYGKPAHGREAVQPNKRKAAKGAAGAAPSRRRTGLLLAGGVAVSSLALVVALGAANPGLVDRQAFTGGPGGWWGQLQQMWSPGVNADNGDGSIPTIESTTLTTPALATTVIALGPTLTAAPPATATMAPTSTPVMRNTETPVPTATAPATSTPPPTSTAVTRVAAAPAALPTLRAEASPTPVVVATSTPAMRAGQETAAATTMPADDSSAAAGEQQSTPVPERVVSTPTPLPTPAVKPSAAATVPTTPQGASAPVAGADASATAAPLDLSKADVRLVEPEDGYTGHGAITFRWETDYQLQEKQAFELVFWQAGGEPMRDGRGWGGTTRTMSSTINWDNMDLPAGGYKWGVLLVKTDPYERIHYMGGDNRFEFTGSGK